jgi:hypothetical protein
MDSDNRADDDTPAEQPAAASKLKLITHYALLAFAPVFSVAALIVAVIAISNNPSRSDRAQLSEYSARIEVLSASLAESKKELENHNFIMAREKSIRAEDRKKSDEREAKIIQNVSRLQLKLKVTPTLEDQLREASAVPAVTSAASAPVSTAPSVPALLPAAADKKNVDVSPAAKPHAGVPIAPVAEKKATTAPVANAKQSAPVPAVKKAEKPSAQVKTLKDAIEKFNKD